MTKTYIIYKSEYMYDEGPKMYEFKGTWRELLYHLHGTTDNNVPDWADEETDEYLKDLFEQINGDGMPCYLVWDVENSEQVIK